MRILESFGKDDLATVYVAEFENGRIVEFVESLQPPIPRSEKWVLIVSTSFGCPVRCLLCDAGGRYQGRLSAEEIFAQLDFLVSRRYSDLRVPAGKFKIQFARMGEPALNREVIEILDRLPDRYRAPGLIPCISSIAPAGTDRFFEELLIIKDRLYRGGRFQMQFSIHSTDPETRDRLMPVPKWPLARIADYGRRFYRPGDRKVCLNFAMIRGIPLGPDVLAEIFDPVHFLIKLTPLNPTHEAARHGLETSISPTAEKMECDIIKALKDRGFDVLLSIGEHEENLIGSNCGQYIMRHYREAAVIRQSYTYVPQSPGSSYPAA